MLWLVILFLLLALTLLFAPLRLSVNTDANRYFISFARFLKVSAYFLTDDIAIRYRLFGIEGGSTLLEIAADKKHKKSIPEKVADNVAKTSRKRISGSLFVKLLKTFTVKKFYLDIDFGSVYYNAWLYPLGEILQRKNLHFATNFSGKNSLEIEIINRPAYVIWAIIKTQLKTKTS